MALRILSPVAVRRLMELSKQSYRPPEIVTVNKEIEGKIRAAMLKESITGQIDSADVKEIVRLKLKLDHLYILWAESELE